MSKVVLIGFMGAGKTETGKLLADFLGVGLIDMDLLAEQEFKMSVADIFREKGEYTFRSYEEGLAKLLHSESNAVISTGGGIVESIDGMAALKQNSFTVYLRCDFETSFSRANGSNRPLLEDKETGRKLYEKRQAMYQQYADFTIDTDHKTPHEVASEIYHKFQELNP